jgi:phosphonopyruvate decarboxylase
MDILSACKAIEDRRENHILVATMGAMTAFDQLGAAQPRINSVPLMGGAASIGLGLAIARPDIGVIVVDGDASLLMQLGVLATVAEQQPEHFFHFVVNNGAQFTGFSNLGVAAGGRVDFAGLARAAGYRRAIRIAEEAELQAALDGLLSEKGPVLVELVVEPSDPKPGVPAVFEIPDQQFQRMGAEAQALSAWLKSIGNG